MTFNDLDIKMAIVGLRDTAIARGVFGIIHYEDIAKRMEYDCDYEKRVNNMQTLSHRIDKIIAYNFVGLVEVEGAGYFCFVDDRTIEQILNI